MTKTPPTTRLNPDNLLGKDFAFAARRVTIVAYDPAKGWKLLVWSRVSVYPDTDGVNSVPAWLPPEMLERLIYEGILVAS